MEKLTLDIGIVEYEINGNGVLRFNPMDPNLYHRFTEMYKELPELTAKYSEIDDDEIELDENGFPVELKGLEATKEFDKHIKERLAYVFGEGNDFDVLLNGVNLMATTNSGTMVLENLFAMLTPIIQKHADQRDEKAKTEVAAAVAKAKASRAARPK